MIVSVIYFNENTGTFTGIDGQIWNTEEKLLILEKNEKKYKLKNVHHYAVFADSGAELLKVTLGKEND